MGINELFYLWAGRCAYCGTRLRIDTEQANEPEAPTRDHFIPISAGGAKSKRNHVLACRKCNTEKGPMDPRTVVRVWHELDAKGLRNYLDKLDPPVGQPPAGIASRLKALLKSKSSCTKIAN